MMVSMIKKRNNISDTKLRILKEAQAVFSQKGFAAAGIDEIANKTGIVKSVIYYHFKNKKDILDTIIDRFIEESLEFRTKKVSDITQGNFGVVIDAMLDFLVDRKEVIQILYMQSVLNSDEIPLFRLLDTFFSITTEVNSGNKKEEIENMKIEEFYMFHIPLVNFILFSDKWCNAYRIQRKLVKEKFARIIESYIKDVYMPVLCR